MADADFKYSPESKIWRDERGHWWDDQTSIDQANIEAAFDRWLEVAPDGRYILCNDRSYAYVRVFGAPVFVKRARIEKESVFLSLSKGIEEVLIPTSLRSDKQGRIYSDVLKGCMTAIFLSEAVAPLIEYIQETKEGASLCLGTNRYLIPIVDGAIKAPLCTVKELPGPVLALVPSLIQRPS